MKVFIGPFHSEAGQVRSGQVTSIAWRPLGYWDINPKHRTKNVRSNRREESCQSAGNLIPNAPSTIEWWWPWPEIQISDTLRRNLKLEITFEPQARVTHLLEFSFLMQTPCLQFINCQSGSDGMFRHKLSGNFTLVLSYPIQKDKSRTGVHLLNVKIIGTWAETLKERQIDNLLKTLLKK